MNAEPALWVQFETFVLMARFRSGVRCIVLVCSDIFKHLRGLGRVDKIRKYRRDSPSGVFTDLGHRSVKTPSENPRGIPYYITP